MASNLTNSLEDRSQYSTPTTDFELEERIQQLEKPYRHEEILRYCYYELGLSLNETADKLEAGCESTIRYWMNKHDIERRDRLEALKRDGIDPSFTPDGYMNFVSHRDGESNTVSGHALLACLDNDPHEVFASDTHVHHKIGTQIDFPENIEVLTRKEHRQKHSGDTFDAPDIDDLLRQDDEAGQ